VTAGALTTYVRIRAGGAWHAQDGFERAACGLTGKPIDHATADDRAVRVKHAPVCGNCRDVLDNRRRDVHVASTPTRATSPEGGTMTTTTERKKAASTPLLDPAKYATTSAKRLREERATISNRLSGVKTQLKRTDDAKKTRELEKRQKQLTGLRDKVNKALKTKTDDLAEATQAQAASTVDDTREIGEEVAAGTK
jgi:hypothetical protein